VRSNATSGLPLRVAATQANGIRSRGIER